MSPLRAPVSIPVLLAVSCRRLLDSGWHRLRLLLCVPAVYEDGVDEGLHATLGHDGSAGQLEQLLVVQESQLDTSWEHSLLAEIPGEHLVRVFRVLTAGHSYLAQFPASSRTSATRYSRTLAM